MSPSIELELLSHLIISRLVFSDLVLMNIESAVGASFAPRHLSYSFRRGFCPMLFLCSFFLSAWVGVGCVHDGVGLEVIALLVELAHDNREEESEEDQNPHGDDSHPDESSKA